MAGATVGVAVKIQELEPRAVFTHCYGRALNLAVCDTITNLPRMKDCLDTYYEIVKLIKFSPKREAMQFNRRKRWVVILQVLVPYAQQGGLFMLNHYIVFLPTMSTFCCCGN